MALLNSQPFELGTKLGGEFLDDKHRSRVIGKLRSGMG